MVSSDGPMADGTTEISSKTSNRARGPSTGKKCSRINSNTDSIKSWRIFSYTDLYVIGLIIESTMANGKMESSMASASNGHVPASRRKEYGKMADASNICLYDRTEVSLR